MTAPCVVNPSADIQEAGGFNVNGGAKMVACVNYANTGDAAGDYFLEFNGTSSATPITAGARSAAAGVDAADARVRRAQHHRVGPARQAHVIGVAAEPLDEARVLEARDGLVHREFLDGDRSLMGRVGTMPCGEGGRKLLAPQDRPLTLLSPRRGCWLAAG